MRIYRSSRVARYHPPYRQKGTPPPDPIYQVVRGYPESCACPFGLAIVGENPGADEDQAGFPFVGRSGEELDRFLDTYGIDPDACFITNIGRIFNIGNHDPTEDEIRMWEPLLWEELNVARPIWIAAVGRVATRYFLGDVDMEAVHGIPFMVVLPWLDNGRGGRVVVIPTYHPAAGFHSTELQANIAYDFAQLDLTIRGRIGTRDPDTADRYPSPYYRDLTDTGDDLIRISDSLHGGTRNDPLIVTIDTEGLPRNPWGLSYSTEPGTAYVIRKVHRVAIAQFYYHLIDGISEGRIHVVLHNSLHDLRVLRELGIPLPDGSYTDTMVLAYHLCIEPQGLKPLAFRHAGMVMSSYPEIVQDAQDRIAVEYYETMEGLVQGGIVYEKPEEVYWEYAITEAKEVQRVATLEMANEEYTLYKNAKVKVYKPKKVVIPASDPISVGPFRYIDPYEVIERDKETGEPKIRTKHPQQIHQRVAKALKEYRSGKIDAAQLRKRWEGTDDLIRDLVEEVIGPMREAGLDDVPLERAIRYAARDADATLRVYAVLVERHRAMGLEKVGEIDHAIIPMVDSMQATGIEIDRPYFQWLSQDLARRMAEKQQEIKDTFGVWINPNSGDQVADLLFGEYGLIPTKYTRGTVDKETGEVKKVRGSTVDKVLEGLRAEHPIIPMILDYRGLLKAKTSFVDVALREAVEEGGRWVVHCLFRITRVSSGRLSATKPNMMAIMKGGLGYEIRKGYIAGEGWEFAEWDLNQVEMRFMASEAGDEFLISMFMNNEDVHAGTTSRMFGLNLPRPYKKSQVDDEKRDAAKRTGFGVITGIQAPGLVDQMRLQGRIVSEDEAAQWIADWLAACPSVPEYMQACHREAMAYGYVRDWVGRIRYLPGIHSPFRHIRAEAGRQSHSHKIQGGAQETMKIGMANIDREVLPYWRAKGKEVWPILQVHDSIMFKRRGFTKAEADEMDAQVRAAMFSAAPPGFAVPLDAGMGTSANWGDMKH